MKMQPNISPVTTVFLREKHALSSVLLLKFLFRKIMT